MKAAQVCSIDGCERGGQMRRGICAMHYERLRASGNFEVLPVLSWQERFNARLERKPNGCLEWTGAVCDAGYGKFTVDGENLYAHRIAWTLSNGPIPKGMVVRHFVCDNPPCADVSHLRLGTHADNVADKIAKGRHPAQKQTHCKNGHEFTPENTYQGKRQRHCRACARAVNHKRRAGSVLDEDAP